MFLAALPFSSELLSRLLLLLCNRVLNHFVPIESFALLCKGRIDKRKSQRLVLSYTEVSEHDGETDYIYIYKQKHARSNVQ